MPHEFTLYSSSIFVGRAGFIDDGLLSVIPEWEKMASILGNSVVPAGNGQTGFGSGGGRDNGR